MREWVPSILPAQRVQVPGIQFLAAVADDFVARHIEHVDAPVGFGREQIGRHAEQLIRIAVGAFGDASAGADVPIPVGVAVNRQNRFPLISHDGRFSTFLDYVM